jgi:hypothetical protein
VDFVEYVLFGTPLQSGEAFQAVLLLFKDHTEDFMMFCDVDGGVIYRDSWSRVRGFFKAKSAKAYANGLVG